MWHFIHPAIILWWTDQADVLGRRPELWRIASVHMANAIVLQP
jgi:hypothetical protein